MAVWGEQEESQDQFQPLQAPPYYTTMQHLLLSHDHIIRPTSTRDLAAPPPKNPSVTVWCFYSI
jgi:hypothetical protein